jgi:predicted RNA-binding Zn-ribbon protein involved in translation (DUF1610 family)
MSKITVSISSSSIGGAEYKAVMKRVNALKTDLESQGVTVRVDFRRETEWGKLQELLTQANKEIVSDSMRWQHMHNLLKQVFVRQVNGEVLPCQGLDLRKTEDSRIMIWANFAARSYYLQRDENLKWTGYYCPKCGENNITKHKETRPKSSSRDHAFWYQPYKCESCGDTWECVEGWVD